MTEIEKIELAKSYLEMLAHGFDPLTNEAVPQSDTVRKSQVSRCLLYVSGLLSDVIDNKIKGSNAAFYSAKPEFSLTVDELKKFRYSDEPIGISEITNRFNKLRADENMRKLKNGIINKWLVEINILNELTDSMGKTVKMPTDAGYSVGLMRVQKVSKEGRPYYSVLYSKQAQQFIVDNFDSFVHKNAKPVPIKQGDAWTEEDEKRLVLLFKQGISFSEIGKELGRSSGAVNARLKLLGLTKNKS